MAGITPQEFVARWSNVELTERASSQSHFIDLCRLLDQPTPTEADPTGDSYTFERGAAKAAGPTKGKRGWADVWKKGHFAWEYKGPHANLDKAYQQLQQYRESLESPTYTTTAPRGYRTRTNGWITRSSRPTGGRRT